MNYWLASIREDNWLVIKELKVYASRRNVARKMAKGDRIIVYIPKKASRSLGGCIVAVLELLSDVDREAKPIFPEEKELNEVLYPYRARVKIVCEGKIPIKEIMPYLSFIKDKERYMVYLQGNPANLGRPIPRSDGELILSKLGQR